MKSRYSLLEALGIDRSPVGSATSELLESHGIDTPTPEETGEEVDSVDSSAEESDSPAPQSQSASDPTLTTEGLASSNRSNLLRDDLALARWREMAGLSKKVIRK